MTGFGRSESTWGDAPFTIEIRSVNNRFLEVGCKLPKPLAHLESLVRNTVRGRLTRGSITCIVSMGMGDKDTISMTYQDHLIQEYLRIAREIQKKYGVSGEVGIQQILALPDLVQFIDSGANAKELEQHLVCELEKALDVLCAMRKHEGANLAADLRSRVLRLDEILDQVQTLDSGRIAYWRDRFQTRIQELMGDSGLDPIRVLQEASIVADRLDITEEITRFRSHNQLFLHTLDEASNQGKKLNFILQEMGREANTLGTKCQTASIAALAIRLKDEVETIREQVQNIE